jgi:hypothetical protein
MGGAQVLRHRPRVRGLVVALLLKADGEGVHRPAAARLHERDDQRRIDPARQKRSYRHVRDHAAADGVAEQRIESVESLRFADFQAIGLRGRGDLRGVQ